MTFKRITALAMALVIGVATAGFSASAAEWNRDAMLRVTQSRSSDGAKITKREVIAFDYAYFTTKKAAADSKELKTFVYREASETKSEQVTDTKDGKKAVTVTLAFTNKELDALKAEGVTVRLSDLALPVPTDFDAAFAGWATVKTVKVFSTQEEAAKTKGFVAPDAEITPDLCKNALYTLYPVFRNKTQAELAAEAEAEAKAEKIAVDQNGTEISAAKVSVNVKALDEQKVDDALKATGADASNAVLYDITVTDRHGDKVEVLEGKAVTVTLARPSLDGNVSFKLYHIENGKAEEMEIAVSDDAITFESDEFSPYVLTWTVSAHTPASGGSNPPTGDDLNVGLLIGLAAGALVVAVVVLVIRSKRGKGGDDE